MEFYQLKYFYYAAKYQNISAASRKLMVAQSSISKAIANLETELQTELFIRNGKRIRLSGDGALLCSRIAPILSAVDAIPDCFHSDDAVSSTLRLRVLSASALIPDILAKFQALEPKIRFQLLQSSSEEDVDLTIFASPHELFDRNTVLLTREEILLAVPSASPLSLSREVTLEQLERESMVMLSEDRLLREQIEHVFRSAGLKMQVNFESDNPFLVRMLVQNGLGITVWPSQTWSAYSSDNLRFLPFCEPRIYRNVYMRSNPERGPSDALNRFMRYLSRYFAAIPPQR